MVRLGTVLLAGAGVLAFAPWAVFLAGVAKLMDVFNSNHDSVWLRQQAYMLEWYEVWMELVIIIEVIVLGAANVPRAASFLQMWLAVNTALIIYSATDRLIAINAINDDGTYGQYTSNNLVALRCTVAGQISTAFWNFVMSIILAVSGALVSDSASARAKSGAAEATATAA